MARRIAVAANKGGVGKTTVAVNLAGAIAARGHQVVVVDADPQGAATIGLGVDQERPSLYDVIAGDSTAAAAVVDSPTAGIRVLPATTDLAGAEVELPTQDRWQTKLRRALAPLERSCDVIIIDTPPGLGVLSYAALSAAELVLVACPPDFLAVRALPVVLESSDRAGVELIGIVPTMVGSRTRHETDFGAYLQAEHGRHLLPAIPRRVVLRDALAVGQPVSVYAPSSDAAAAFDTLAQEVLAHAAQAS